MQVYLNIVHYGKSEGFCVGVHYSEYTVFSAGLTSVGELCWIIYFLHTE